MEPNSQVSILEDQIRNSYGRIVWTHKTQEKCADILLKRHSRIKITQIILSALTTTGVLVAVFGENEVVGIITAVFSAILFGINAYTKGYDLGKASQEHASAAADLWNIREEYLSLLTDMRSENASPKEIVKKREKLQEKLSGIYKGSPRTISKAYKEASEGLKVNEEMTFSDEEIDLLLPTSLRKGNTA